MKLLLIITFAAGMYFGMNYDQIMDDHVKVYTSKFKKEIKDKLDEQLN